MKIDINNWDKLEIKTKKGENFKSQKISINTEQDTYVDYANIFSTDGKTKTETISILFTRLIRTT